MRQKNIIENKSKDSFCACHEGVSIIENLETRKTVKCQKPFKQLDNASVFR